MQSSIERSKSGPLTHPMRRWQISGSYHKCGEGAWDEAGTPSPRNKFSGYLSQATRRPIRTKALRAQYARKRSGTPSGMLQARSQPNSIGRFIQRLVVRKNGAINANKKVVLDDGVEGANSIAPSNFLSFFIGTAVVRDTDFVNPAAGTGYFGGDFGFESETVFAQVKVPDDGRAECLVTGFNVGEINVCAHV